MSLAYIRGLKKLCESRNSREVAEMFGEAIRTRQIDPYSIRMPQLATAFLGDDYGRSSSMLRAIGAGQTLALESTEAVDASAFSNITGQLLITIIKEKYNAAEFIGDQLCRTIPNPPGNLKTHIVPYLSDVLAKPSDKIEQGMPYPQTRFSESYVTLPAPEKRGEICALTMEMIYSDLTGQAQDSASSVGRALRYQKEERILRVVLGIDTPYVWNGNALGTYVATATTGNYANKLLSETITNYQHINDVEQLFVKMVDPITGRRIQVGANAILCQPEKYYEMKRILGATEVRVGNSASDTGVQMNGASPLETSYKILKSAISQDLLLNVANLSASVVKERVLFGNFQKAFVYREVFPMQTEQAPVNNPMEFQQDITLAIKVNEFGVACVFDPRYVIQSTSEAS